LKTFYRGLKRIQSLVDDATKKGLKVLVDAEYTYMNPGISAIALALMVQFNKITPTVANTYQCYLKVRGIHKIWEEIFEH